MLNLDSLNGSNGFRIDGIDVADYSGSRVSNVGDLNGDGLHDVIIGAWRADPNGNSAAGESYVLFGKTGSFASAISLNNLSESSGFRIEGINPNDYSGISVSGAGDVNGDGFDDLIVGASGADPGGNSSAGQSYVLFGKSGGFGPVFGLSSLDGTNGFRVDGVDSQDRSGASVSKAGDINGDGFDDLIIGAGWAAPGGNFRGGKSYVLLGNSGNFPSAISLSSLNGINGFRMDGIDALDTSGFSVSSAGDVDGDGFDDFIIGAPWAGHGETFRAGESYLVFGANLTGQAETQVGTGANDILSASKGPAALDRLIGGRGNDLLVSDGGPDVLIGGQGDDILVIKDLLFSRLAGGTGFDTIRVDGSGVTLDLTSLPNNRMVDIEQIDITGSGDNSLILTPLEVLNLSFNSNMLLVRRDAGDIVNIGTGWIQQADETIEGNPFEVFTQGGANLKLQKIATPASIVASYVYHHNSSFDLPGNLTNALDSGKQLAKEGPTAFPLGFDNLVNGSRGINGLVFDIANLGGTVTAEDFVFQMSPTGAFEEGLNSPSGWQVAPTPTNVVVQSGSPNRVVVTWPNNAIANRWLRITVLANLNTGLSDNEVYYLGHLLGETTGPSGSVFTVAFADITPIRTSAGSNVNSGSIADIDKNGTVSFADISAMRANVGAQLTIITIATSVGGGSGSAPMFGELADDSSSQDYLSEPTIWYWKDLMDENILRLRKSAIDAFFGSFFSRDKHKQAQCEVTTGTPCVKGH